MTSAVLYPFLAALSLFLILPQDSFAVNFIEEIAIADNTQGFLTVTCRDEIRAYNSFHVGNPDRMVIDILGAEVGPEVERNIPVSQDRIRSVRSGNHETFARVVIDIEGSEIPDFTLMTDGNILRVAIAQEDVRPESSSTSFVQVEPPVDVAEGIPSGRPEKHTAKIGSATRSASGYGVGNSAFILASSEEITLGEVTELEEEGAAAGRGTRLEADGKLAVKYSRDLRRDDDFENLNDLRVLFEGSLKYSFTPQNFIKAGIRYRYIREWEGTGFDYSKVFPGEIYLNLAGGDGYLGIGTQIVRWGRTDEISPIDVINPEDLTELFINRRAERKLAVPMVRLGLLHGPGSLEFIYLPVFRESEIIYFESDWAVFPHVRGRLASVSPPPVQGYISNLQLEENKPSSRFENGEWGARLAGSLPNLDVGLSYFYGWEDTPLPAARTERGESIRQIIFHPERAAGVFSSLPSPVTGDDLTFDMEFHRFHLFGLDAATTWRDIGFRAEAAYFKDRHFITSTDGTLVREDNIHLVFGADYTLSDNVYLNALYSFDKVLDSGRFELRPRTQQDIVGNITWDIREEVLTLSMFAFYSLSDGSLYFNPLLLWDALDNFTLETGFNLIWADEGDILSPYRDNDTVYVSATCYF
jgi:hypothetical protein